MTANQDGTPAEKTAPVLPPGGWILLVCIGVLIFGALFFLDSRGASPLSRQTDLPPTVSAGQASTPTPLDTPTPILSRTPTNPGGIGALAAWDLYYDWGCDGEPAGPARLVLNDNATFTLLEHDGSTAYGVWLMYAGTLDFIFNDPPFAHYLGTQTSDSRMEGSMENTAGSSGCWYAQPPQVSDPGEGVRGDWQFFYDWACSGDYSGPLALTFFDDHTFQLVEGGSLLGGSWESAGDQVEFLFADPPHARYSGTIDFSLTYLQGGMEMEDGNTGCWYARK